MRQCLDATTNRVRKPAAPGRNARGYVYVDDTSRTVSPDVILETPPTSPSHRRVIDETRPARRRVIEETPPPSSREADRDEIARLQAKLRHHRHKSHRHSSRKEDSEDDSDDSDVGDRPRVSFLHHAGNKPFLAVHEHYPAVHMKYFRQIYYGTFQPGKSMRLSHNALAWGTTPKGKKDKDDATPDPAESHQEWRQEMYAFTWIHKEKGSVCR